MFVHFYLILPFFYRHVCCANYLHRPTSLQLILLFVFLWKNCLQKWSINLRFIFRKKKPAQLQVVSVQSTSIPPKETVTYTKQTQTTHSSNERDGMQLQFFFCVNKNCGTNYYTWLRFEVNSVNFSSLINMNIF